jgi:hypothetical protein
MLFNVHMKVWLILVWLSPTILMKQSKNITRIINGKLLYFVKFESKVNHVSSKPPKINYVSLCL